MEITDVRAVDYDLPDPEPETEPRREPWSADARVANPMTRYPRYADSRSSWRPEWETFGVCVEASDGTTGFALANHGTPVAAVVDQHLGPRLEGENPVAIEKLHDMAVRLCSPFGATGLASYAVSAVDLALWDLKGKLLERPVYELLGGPARDELRCYATGNDTDWHLELGFEATKLACPYGPADGREGLDGNREFVAERRELVGDDVDLMLDCWMAFDAEYATRLANELRPYDLRWMEECLPPENLDGYADLRRRVPWQTLTTGEHWYATERFRNAVERGLVDVLQPDVNWVGGLTALRKIVDIAEAAGVSVVPHGGGNTPYGQHACYALPGVTWTEYFVASPPGVPLEETARLPGTPAPEDGTLEPSDVPGFGVDVDPSELSPFTYPS